MKLAALWGAMTKPFPWHLHHLIGVRGGTWKVADCQVNFVIVGFCRRDTGMRSRRRRPWPRQITVPMHSVCFRQGRLVRRCAPVASLANRRGLWMAFISHDGRQFARPARAPGSRDEVAFLVVPFLRCGRFQPSCDHWVIRAPEFGAA